MNSTMPPESSPPISELDVRPIIAARGAPMGAILTAIDALPPGGALRLIAPFEPVPLYAKLVAMGFDHTTTARDDGAWEILFTPRRATPTAEPLLLDLRGLEPPEPLRRALETLATLPKGGVLIALTRFRPVHLFSVLDERGIPWESHEQPDGSWESIITNGPSA
jgi:uncharacterized protein (DUF2249 family)